MTTTAATDVDALVDELLSAHDPRTTDAVTFRGAQYDRGLAWVHFPVGFGGLGLPGQVQRQIDTRLREAGAPPPQSMLFFNLYLAAPTMVTHGSDELRKRALRPMFTGEDVWCQLFSEPGSGSDLAGLSTRAVRDGDEWVVNGQKVWNTLAHLAGKGMLVARTDPELPKHKGLTYFMVDMHAPGVEVRPLRQITGEAEFNEVYLTDVRVPDADRIGDVGDGWRVSMTTLMNERTTIGAGVGGPKRGGGSIAEAIYTWEHTTDHSPTRRNQLMKLWCDAEVLRLTNMRASQRRPGRQPRPRGFHRQARVRQPQQGRVRVVHRHARPGRHRRLRLHVPPPDRGAARRRAGHGAQAVPALACELDRRRHVGDHAQHPRRADPRPARRAACRPRPPVVAGTPQLNEHQSKESEQR